MRILVTGGTGYLGAALLRYIHLTRPDYSLTSTYFSSSPSLDFASFVFLDLRDPHSIEQVVQASRPDLIVHTAAQMQGTVEALQLVNATGSGLLASLAAEIHSRFIHLSTDLVFDGRRGNYVEADNPNPVNDYGRSKLSAESAVLKSTAEFVIVRTSLIYGVHPVDPRTRAMLDGEMPRLFTDERRCPIWVDTLCAALLELAEGHYAGILHVAGGQVLNRYELGTRLVRFLGGDVGRLIPTRSEESGLVRPLDCSLDCSRARALLQTKLPGVDEVLDSAIY